MMLNIGIILFAIFYVSIAIETFESKYVYYLKDIPRLYGTLNYLLI